MEGSCRRLHSLATIWNLVLSNTNRTDDIIDKYTAHISSAVPVAIEICWIE